jgi:plastocyanin
MHYNRSMYNNFKFIIIAIILIFGVNLYSVSFKSVNAQNTDYIFEPVQHMMGPGMHMMGPGIQQMQQNPNSFSTSIGNNTTNNKNQLFVSIVFGAASYTTVVYQPNLVYIKEGQTIIWSNNDNNIHTVTQKNYPSFTNSFGNTLGFNSGILNRGQSFAQVFNKEGTYNYYCTIHPWMVGQVIVSSNSNSNTTNTVANTNNTINSSTNNNNKSTISLSSSLPTRSMLQRGNIAMGFDQNKLKHNFITNTNGGKITITSLNGNDTTTINQIREHIKDIQNDFSNGNFTRPFFIHAQEVPGTKIMSEKRNLIEYSIKELTNGSELILNTNDKELLGAIHQFITFQDNQRQSH